MPHKLLLLVILYLVTFSVSGGTVTVLSPIDAQRVYISASYVEFLNVTYPVYQPVLAIQPVNASAGIAINTTGILLDVTSNASWEVSIWSIPEPLGVSGAPSYSYDPLTGNLTIYGSGNATVFVSLIWPNARYSVEALDISHELLVDVVALIAIILCIAYGTWLFFRWGPQSLLLILAAAIASFLLSGARSAIPSKIVSVNGVQRVEYIANPLTKIYFILGFLAIILLSLLVVWRFANPRRYIVYY